MKQILTLLLLSGFTAYSQDTTYNHFSVDAQFGLNNPIYPMSPEYDAATLNLFHVGLGFRYAINTKFGIRLGGGYDNFREGPGSRYFSSEYYRVSLEGVANLGNIMDFQSWTRRIGLLFHMGAGYSVLNGSLINPNHMMHGIIGFTPQVHLSEHFSLNVDATVIGNIYQNYTYDLQSAHNGRGVDGYLINLSIGLQYYFGRRAQHADWVIVPNKTLKYNHFDSGLRNWNSSSATMMETELSIGWMKSRELPQERLLTQKVVRQHRGIVTVIIFQTTLTIVRLRKVLLP